MASTLKQFRSLLFFDFLFLTGSWFAAYGLRFYTFFEIPLGRTPYSQILLLLPVIWVIWFGLGFVNGFYTRSLQKRSAVLESLDLAKTVLLFALIFLGFLYFYFDYQFSRSLLLIYAVLLWMALVQGRSIRRKMRRQQMRTMPPKNVLLICEDAKEDVGKDLVGEMNYLDRKLSVDRFSPEVLAQPDDLLDAAARGEYEQACLYVDFHVLETNRTFFEKLFEQILDTKVVIPALSPLNYGATLQYVQGLPVLSVHESGLMLLVNAMQKRLFDILFSSVALLLVSPLMLLLAGLVKCSSPGPIFFRQKRVGLDGSEFDCLKFRTMPVTAEEKSGPQWATATDTRATPIGAFLRRFSLDELPQFINVLRGEMSVVGPRPERPFFVNKFRKEIRSYMLRHKAKAGITGWAQVNGLRGDTSLEKRIAFDIEYIQNWSLLFDLKIIVLTIREVFFSKSAY